MLLCFKPWYFEPSSFWFSNLPNRGQLEDLFERDEATCAKHRSVGSKTPRQFVVASTDINPANVTLSTRLRCQVEIVDFSFRLDEVK